MTKPCRSLSRRRSPLSAISLNTRSASRVERAEGNHDDDVRERPISLRRRSDGSAFEPEALAVARRVISAPAPVKPISSGLLRWRLEFRAADQTGIFRWS